MKYCAIYKTAKKDGLYLYVPEKGKFDSVPDTLMAQIGQPKLVMMLPLDNDKSLASVDKQTLIDQLNEKGFYLQLPPQSEDWLAEHRIALGLSPQPTKRNR
ncbi:YcgL domain-containing protein [Alteromonas sediminis]|uniref:YcgL domain-containing protein DRW07_17350 n=1 Tax=Alteromonas sediminis TaxID=2259342 RepID=A0A3N5YJY5_9ALTE|nr:YcgL domain-containing protein [Alteromonas sediminis]RPJ65081.1 YcgL domain-containing protein [Alteromonas sediminis]